MTTRVTIREVASLAGVSVATVSRVLNDRPDVAAKLRRRVVEAVADLDYRPSSAARNLRTHGSRVLGLVIADVSNPFFTAVARGVEDAAHHAGYSVLLANTDEDLAKEQQYLDVAVAERLAGVILAPASSTQSDVSVLRRAGVPLVTIDRQLRHEKVDSVIVDNFGAAFEATTHLLEEGCARVAFVAGPTTVTTSARRLAGYRAALRSWPSDPDERLIARGDFRVAGGRRAIALMSRRSTFDGVVVANSLMTIGVIEGLAALGKLVPRDVAVVSFDEDPWFSAHRPSLTVVTQPTYEIGAQATRLLLSRIAEPTHPPRKVSLGASLCVMESSSRGTWSGADRR